LGLLHKTYASLDAQHKLTAKFTDTCSKAGEDYKIDDVKIDVLKFH